MATHRPANNKLLFWITALVASSIFLQCHAFARSTPAESREFASSTSRGFRKTQAYLSPSSSGTLFKLRGGSSDTASSLALGLSDYSEAARSLFGNMIGPASMITGGLVPLGFLAEPLPGDKKIHKRLRSLYFLISVFSLCNELLAIAYATVASNKLIETVVTPAASVFALIQRDYELPWIATNVHFMAGLFGFIAMVCLRCYAILPSNINKAAAGVAGSFLLGMLSVVNSGIQEGDRAGKVFGRSVPGMALRYMVMLFRSLQTNGGPLALAAIVLGLTSTIVAAKAIIQEDDSIM